MAADLLQRHPDQSSRLKISRVDSVADFAALCELWDRLSAADAATSIFQTWEWQFHWWTVYGGADRLYVLQALDENGVLVGILPLFLRTRRAGLPGVTIRELALLGTGGDTSPDYLGPIVAVENEEAMASAVMTYLRAHEDEWDLLSLGDLRKRTTFIEGLRAAAAEQQWHWRSGVAERISFVSLPSSWEAFLATLHRDRRYAVRKIRKNFLALEGARFFVWDDPNTLDKAFDRLSELHRARWSLKNEAHSFSSPEYLRFHREVMRDCLARGWLRLYCLELRGRVIAMYYCYAFAGTTYYFQGGFDPEEAQLRPGLCLMGFAIEHAIFEGHTQFDMLRGDYEYKKQWAKEQRNTYAISCEQPSLRVALYRANRHAWPRAKRFVKSLLFAGLAAAQKWDGLET